MANVKSSLSDYLNQPNPKVSSKHSWEGSNSRSTNNAWVNFDHVHKWEDFEYDTITRPFNDKLMSEVDRHDLPNFNNGLPFHLKEIHDEDSLEALLVRWTNAVVSTALAVAQRGDNSIDSDASPDTDEIFMARGGQAWIPDTNMTQKSVRPDWAGIQANNTEEVVVNCQKRKSYRNILPGDSKLSSKWTIESFLKDKIRDKYRSPLRQICTYCERAGVRYGYLITQEALVVVRLSYRESTPEEENPANSRSTPPSPQLRHSRRVADNAIKAKTSLPAGAKKRKVGKLKRILEYRKIDWALEGLQVPEALTINLALWCIHMMAKQDGVLDTAEEYELPEHIDASFTSDTQTSTSAGTGRARKRRKGKDSSFHSDVSLVY